MNLQQMNFFKPLTLFLFISNLVSFCASAANPPPQPLSEKKIPILISKFYPSSISGSDLAWEQSLMSKVIARDLEKSGHFQILDPKKFPNATLYRSDPIFNSNENYEAWRKSGIKFLIVSRTFFFEGRPQGKNIYEIEFQLLDVTKGKQIIGTNFVSPMDEFRTIGHYIAEQIYKHLINANSELHLKSENTKINLINSNTEMPESISRLFPENWKRVANKAANGDIHSARNIGKAFFDGKHKGIGLEKNHIAAEYFFKIAAKSGDITSLQHLAQMYYDDDDVDRNLELSVKYYRQIALQDTSSRPFYKDLVRSLIASGGDNNLLEATQWMDKEMKAKSIEIDSTIKGAEEQFQYLYEGGYQKRRQAIIAAQRRAEIQIQINKTGFSPITLFDVTNGISSKDQVRDIYRNKHAKKIEERVLNDGKTELVCYQYHSIIIDNGLTDDCFFIQKNRVVGMILNLTELKCYKSCGLATAFLKKLRNDGFIVTKAPTDSSVITTYLQRKKEYAVVQIWGISTIMTSTARQFSGLRDYKYYINQYARLCLFQNKIKSVIESEGFVSCPIL